MHHEDGEYLIYSVQSRPDLGESLSCPEHPFNTLWPEFFQGNKSEEAYFPQLLKYEELAKFVYVVVWKSSTGQETPVALGNSVPFFWPELDAVGGRAGSRSHPEVFNKLPDGGFDTILSRGVEQYRFRQGLPPLSPAMTEDQVKDLPIRQLPNAPNALSALSITIIPDRRSQGLAEMIVEEMKETAREEKLQVLVVPLRPTRKSDYPTIDMSDYITWTKGTVPKKGDLEGTKDDNPSRIMDPTVSLLPFDPWLRKHVSLGGRAVKVAGNSMLVEGSTLDWQRWTGIDLQNIQKSENEQPYIDICIPRGLFPMKFYPDDSRGVYTESNIWVYHDLVSPPPSSGFMMQIPQAGHQHCEDSH